MLLLKEIKNGWRGKKYHPKQGANPYNDQTREKNTQQTNLKKNKNNTLYQLQRPTNLRRFTQTQKLILPPFYFFPSNCGFRSRKLRCSEWGLEAPSGATINKGSLRRANRFPAPAASTEPHADKGKYNKIRSYRWNYIIRSRRVLRGCAEGDAIHSCTRANTWPPQYKY